MMPTLEHLTGSNDSASVEQPLKVAIFESSRDNLPKQASTPWPEFVVTALSSHDERESKDGECWSPVSYRDGATRGLAGVESVSALVFDIDGSDLPYELLVGFEWLAHTTYSHEPGCPKWRLIFPLARPVPADDWPGVIQRALAWIGVADRQCSDASRLFYFPSCPPGAERHVERGNGRRLDPDELPEAPQSEPRTTRFDVASLLANGAPEGGRDAGFFRLAAALRHYDVPLELALLTVQGVAERSDQHDLPDWRAKVLSAYRRYAPSVSEEEPATLPGPLHSKMASVYRNKTLSPRVKLVAWAVACDKANRESRGLDGPWQTYRKAYAEATGQSEQTVGNALTELDAMLALTKRKVENRRDNGRMDDSATELTLPGSAIDFLDYLATVDGKRPEHGGKREPGCLTCPPGTPVLDSSTCTGCGERILEHIRVPKSQDDLSVNDTPTDDLPPKSQDDLSVLEPSGSPKSQDDPPKYGISMDIREGQDDSSVAYSWEPKPDPMADLVAEVLADKW